MRDFPYHYVVVASGRIDDQLELKSSGLPVLYSAPPIEFDGPGNRWSPETLLVAAVGGCFILTFRAVARASKLTYVSIECETRGTLERVDRRPQFRQFDVHARLILPPDVDHELARRVLKKAENSCLITRSLKGESHLTVEIDVAQPARELIEA
jgi:organic hydroperoxide reductase OsmC/OhrA